MRRSFSDFSEEVRTVSANYQCQNAQTEILTDLKLMAGTLLFLASKIEEEPLKLRIICNHCIEKFEGDSTSGWHPTDDHGVSPYPIS